MKFDVKPRLLSDNKTLEVQLKVNANSYAVIDGSDEMPEDKWNIHVEGRDERGQHFDWVYPIFQPRFYKRNLDIITNIYDGDTIVVGGMVESQAQSVNDKIPFLGDLPFIGRLFQSSSETVKRTNMLIFLSARLMKNDGTPLNVGKPTGLPDFNR
jgi:type II secretory pathway component GspD/PulD (secretin)